MLAPFRVAAANRSLLARLIRHDIVGSYSGSVLGNAWVIIDPIMYVCLTFFFFQFAIKGVATGGIPYVAWVLPQIVFWTFISATVNSSVNSVREYSFLLRHKEMDLRLIAIIKLFSATFVHLVLISVAYVGLVILTGIGFGLLTLAAVYYFLAMCCLLVAISWIVGSLGVFWKDIRNLVSLIMQVEFWVSPIFWEPDRFPAPIAFIMYLNPFYYPMHGYRQSILADGFGPHFLIMTVYFWILVAMLLYFGSRLFRRLSRGFGDAL